MINRFKIGNKIYHLTDGVARPTDKQLDRIQSILSIFSRALKMAIEHKVIIARNYANPFEDNKTLFEKFLKEEGYHFKFVEEEIETFIDLN